MHEMTSRLQNTKTQTKHLLQQTSTLQQETNKNELQQSVSAAFLKKYQLTPDQLFALHGNKHNRDVPITTDIFLALNQTQKIHEDCKILMQVGLQTLALDIMEQMTLHQVNIV